MMTDRLHNGIQIIFFSHPQIVKNAYIPIFTAQKLMRFFEKLVFCFNNEFKCFFNLFFLIFCNQFLHTQCWYPNNNYSIVNGHSYARNLSVHNMNIIFILIKHQLYCWFFSFFSLYWHYYYYFCHSFWNTQQRCEAFNWWLRANICEIVQQTSTQLFMKIASCTINGRVLSTAKYFFIFLALMNSHSSSQGFFLFLFNSFSFSFSSITKANNSSAHDNSFILLLTHEEEKKKFNSLLKTITHDIFICLTFTNVHGWMREIIALCAIVVKSSLVQNLFHVEWFVGLETFN